MVLGGGGGKALGGPALQSQIFKLHSRNPQTPLTPLVLVIPLVLVASSPATLPPDQSGFEEMPLMVGAFVDLFMS